MPLILRKSFFDRETLLVAKELLGKHIVRADSDGIRASLITEVEAYDGPLDRACHAFRGRTPRTEVMYGPAGTIYVYFVYGMYWMLNIVTGEEGYPAAVLIRGTIEISGPGRLTNFFSIDKHLNGKMLSKKTGLWIEDRGIVIAKKDIEITPRIGISYAGEWALKPYRFVLKSQ